MNAQDLLDYTLGQIDETRRELVEQEAAADPALGESLERLARQIDRLLDDGEPIEPPDGLARRTVQFVAERSRRRAILDFGPSPLRFGWRDFAVAAGIFLMATLTLLPAIRRSQIARDQLACADNLRQLGISFAQYAGEFGSFPYASGSPAPYAGAFPVQLHDAGYLPDLAVLDCPSNGHNRLPAGLPSIDQFVANETRAPRTSPCLRLVDYAYNLGYNHRGEPHPVPAVFDPTSPLLSDRPGVTEAGRIRDGNSPNHGGGGQNVLYADGHVGWHSTRQVNPVDSDLFLNEDRRLGLGLHQWDAVMAPGTTRLDGR
jgi:prepilin-type processing-associated H-X9-DG protein